LNKIGKVKLFAYPSEDFQLFGWLQLLDLILDFFRVHPRFASSFSGLRHSVHRKMRPLKYNLDMAAVAFRNAAFASASSAFYRLM
jgi:hypothetical protein